MFLPPALRHFVFHFDENFVRGGLCDWQQTVKIRIQAFMKGYFHCRQLPRAGSWVVRIGPFHLLAGCRKKRLNHALSMLSLSIGFF